jgi:hypothetical protein
VVQRLLIAWLFVGVPAYFLHRTLVPTLAPVYRATIEVMSTDFIISSVDVGRRDGGDTLRFRANLARPTVVGMRMQYPYGWSGRPMGGLEVNLTLSGLLGYAELLLILSLAWPLRRPRELVGRIAVCMPLMTLLILVDAPSTVIAELWSALGATANGVPHAWLVWSRFLMGGGGFAIAALMAFVAIETGGLRVNARADAVPRSSKSRS